MDMRHLASYRWICLLLMWSCAGCGGGDKGVPTIPVNGTLLIDGQPAEGVSVMCLAADAKPDPSGIYPLEASCQTGLDGGFSLSKFSEKAGLPVGEYVLTFVWLKMVDSPQSSLADKDYLNKLYNSFKKAPHKFKVVEGSDINLGEIKLASKKQK
jgi:hypothetical protein